MILYLVTIAALMQNIGILTRRNFLHIKENYKVFRAGRKWRVLFKVRIAAF
ncbi:MAG: hypothetical protein IJZ68_02315 [Bacteroidaceae bacterium]|nr:hypothetical protein [Bacteroidaceae bacterium]